MLELLFFDDCLKVEEVHDLYGNNLETGPRVVLHALHADVKDPGNILDVNVKNT